MECNGTCVSLTKTYDNRRLTVLLAKMIIRYSPIDSMGLKSEA
jgi:hypothetical protein